MIIYESDSEEVRASKRRANEEEMAKEHKQGALRLPLGIPKDCKIDQPGDIKRSQWDYRLGDTQYTNGVVRNTYFDGTQKKFTALGFAGRAKTQNSGFNKEGGS